MSDPAMVKVATSFETRIIRPASLPLGPVVVDEGQNTMYPSTLNDLAMSWETSVSVSTATDTWYFNSK